MDRRSGKTQQQLAVEKLVREVIKLPFKDEQVMALRKLLAGSRIRFVGGKSLFSDGVDGFVDGVSMTSTHYFGIHLLIISSVCIEEECYEEALQLLDKARGTLSYTQIRELNQKYILASLLNSRTVVLNVNRSRELEPYFMLAKFVEERKLAEVERYASDNMGTFSKDGHLGFIKQLTCCLRKSIIRDLIETEKSLHLSSIAEKTNLNSDMEAYLIISHMICYEKLYAKIHKQGLVERTSENPLPQITMVLMQEIGSSKSQSYDVNLLKTNPEFFPPIPLQIGRSCYAVSVIYLLEILCRIKYGIQVELSLQDLLDCLCLTAPLFHEEHNIPRGVEESNAVFALQHIKRSGVCLAINYPLELPNRRCHVPHFIPRGPRLFIRDFTYKSGKQFSIPEARELLRQKIPLIGKLSSSDALHNLEKGKIFLGVVEEDITGGHCVIIVGFGSKKGIDYFRVCNFWECWADNGVGLISCHLFKYIAYVSEVLL